MLIRSCVWSNPSSFFLPLKRRIFSQLSSKTLLKIFKYMPSSGSSCSKWNLFLCRLLEFLCLPESTSLLSIPCPAKLQRNDPQKKSMVAGTISASILCSYILQDTSPLGIDNNVVYLWYCVTIGRYPCCLVGIFMLMIFILLYYSFRA